MVGLIYSNWGFRWLKVRRRNKESHLSGEPPTLHPCLHPCNESSGDVLVAFQVKRLAKKVKKTRKC